MIWTMCHNYVSNDQTVFESSTHSLPFVCGQVTNGKPTPRSPHQLSPAHPGGSPTISRPEKIHPLSSGCSLVFLPRGPCLESFQTLESRRYPNNIWSHLSFLFYFYLFFDKEQQFYSELPSNGANYSFFKTKPLCGWRLVLPLVSRSFTHDCVTIREEWNMGYIHTAGPNTWSLMFELKCNCLQTPM